MPATVTLSDGTRVTPGVTPDTVPYEGHSMKAQALAVDGGKMDGWQSVPGCDASTSYSCVSGYLPSAVPDLTALAEPTRSRTTRSPWRTRPPGAGTSTSWPAPRTGSREQSAQGGGRGHGRCRLGVRRHEQGGDMLPVAGRTVPAQPACVPDFSLGIPDGGAWEPTLAQHVPTIMDELDAAGVTWKIYAQPSPVAKEGYIWSGCP